MKFEWDEAKRQTNIRDHGIDFTDLEPLFDGETVIMLDDRFDYGEYRFTTLGLLNGMVLLVVHTETDEVIAVHRLVTTQGNVRKCASANFPDGMLRLTK